MLTIDGSQGEGGGQILRTSLALSAITGTPVRIERIRARRPKPGLQRQHLCAVQAAARVCNGMLEGAELGATAITFSPQAPVAGTSEFAIGSAGSATLVLQTVLPVLLSAPGPSTVRISGGTHNPLAPPVEFLAESFLPCLHRCGAAATVALERHGFYPAGGGAITATVQPWTSPVPLDLCERGKALGRHAEAIISNLPAHVAEREARSLKHALHWSHDEVDEREVAAAGPGNILIARLRHAGITTVCSVVGDVKTRAEQVAQRVAQQITRHLAVDAPVCEHLADQLLLPLAIGAGGVFRTGEISDHTRTNAAVIAAFLGPVVTITDDPAGGHRIMVRGRV